MSAIAFELFFRFLWGSFFALFLVSRVETSERFVRIATLIGFVCALVAGLFVMTAAPLSNESYSRGASLVALALGLWLYKQQSTLKRRSGFALWLLAGAVHCLQLGQPLDVLGFVSAALLVGSIFMGQFLGHWFLNVPGVHIQELLRLVKLLIFSIGLRWIAAALAIVLRLLPSCADDRFASFLCLNSFDLIMFLTFSLFSLLAPVLLAPMIYKTTKVRSTQSATGIFYALSVMILLGEGAALYFRILRALPL
jgi:hypothetical protein